MKKYLISAIFLAVLILPGIVSAEMTAQELQAQISALLAQIQALQTQLTQLQGGQTAWCHDFNKNLGVGYEGSEIPDLFTALSKEGFDTPKEGGIFDETVAAAVSGFQQKYFDEILKPANLKYGTGFAGKGTRAKLNQLYGCKIKPKPEPFPCPMYSPPSDDFCTVGKIVYPEKDENGCQRPPKCILPPTENQPPVIHGIEGPTTLKTGETGTWRIKAYDPENGPLTYSVIWGDETGTATSPLSLLPPRRESQTATFTHSYSTAGTYTPAFTVTDNKGLSAKTSIGVNVGGVTQETVSEQVKCLFNGSTTEQKCYTAASYDSSYYGVGCSGKETCVVDIKGYKGDKITWKSSCGGYAYTTMDGENEYAKFNCAGQSITVLSPNGGETWQKGTAYQIRWQTIVPAQSTVPGTVDISLISWMPPCTTTPCPAMPVRMYTIATQTSNDGIFEWTPASTIPDGSYIVRVSGGNLSDDSDSYFKLVTVATPSITVLSPNGGEKWEIGKSYQIKFNIVEGKSGYVDLLVFPEGSESAYVFNDFFNNQKLYAGVHTSNWTISQNVSLGKFLVKAYLKTLPVEGNTISRDISDAPFSIVAAATPSITVLSPNGGETWVVGSTQTIKWSSSGFLPTAKVNISLRDIKNTERFDPYVNYGGRIIAQSVPNNGYYSWTIPEKLGWWQLNMLGVPYKIVVEVVDDHGSTDSSDAPFSIVTAGTQ